MELMASPTIALLQSCFPRLPRLGPLSRSLRDLLVHSWAALYAILHVACCTHSLLVYMLGEGGSSKWVMMNYLVPHCRTEMDWTGP